MEMTCEATNLKEFAEACREGLKGLPFELFVNYSGSAAANSIFGSRYIQVRHAKDAERVGERTVTIRIADHPSERSKIMSDFDMYGSICIDSHHQTVAEVLSRVEAALNELK